MQLNVSFDSTLNIFKNIYITLSLFYSITISGFLSLFDPLIHRFVKTSRRRGNLLIKYLFFLKNFYQYFTALNGKFAFVRSVLCVIQGKYEVVDGWMPKRFLNSP